jgi:uncharacterized integral membrane protein (TIGR00698 family)
MEQQVFKNSELFSRLYFFSALFCIIVFSLTPTFALSLGLLAGLTFGNPYAVKSKPATKYLLQLSIIGLGFGMNFTSVMAAGKDGFVFTLVTISLAVGLGFLLGKILLVERAISYLISIGTAICGGSAIVAVSQVMDADEKEISVSIVIVFILNALALFIFPVIGHMFDLSELQFGIWAAIAIHDTSSVVGATSHYGNEALLTATTIKLARALWIIPVALLTSIVFKKKSNASSFPWFVLFFIVASLINTYFFIPDSVSATIVSVSKTGFSLTLFLIGTGLSASKMRSVGFRPLLQGVLLWIIISISMLVLVQGMG